MFRDGDVAGRMRALNARRDVCTLTTYEVGSVDEQDMLDTRRLT